MPTEEVAPEEWEGAAAAAAVVERWERTEQERSPELGSCPCHGPVVEVDPPSELHQHRPRQYRSRSSEGDCLIGAVEERGRRRVGHLHQTCSGRARGSDDKPCSIPGSSAATAGGCCGGLGNGRPPAHMVR
jgi:hypothetical protein